jgi:hypothetical protein
MAVIPVGTVNVCIAPIYIHDDDDNDDNTLCRVRILCMLGSSNIIINNKVDEIESITMLYIRDRTHYNVIHI